MIRAIATMGVVAAHAALCTIVAAPLTREPWRSRWVVLAFPVVSLGVLGVPFRYPELAVLAGPLFITFLAAVTMAMRGWREADPDP